MVQVVKRSFRYVVIGAGKTGIDALLHLLDIGVNPESIMWIISNDCWYFNRCNKIFLTDLY